MIFYLFIVFDVRRGGSKTPPYGVDIIITQIGNGAFMIIYDKLWETMKNKGFTTYTLREKCGIDSKTVRRLRANDNMETKTLDKLCRALNCRIEDIAEFVED